MANLDLGPAFEEIGRLVAEDVRADPEGTFLYAEAGDGWSAPSIFKDVGDRVVYREGSDDLCLMLIDVWQAEQPGKRWAALHYTISNGRFDVSFFYAEEMNTEEDTIDRRDRVLRARFGDKPVDYSDP